MKLRLDCSILGEPCVSVKLERKPLYMAGAWKQRSARLHYEPHYDLWLILPRSYHDSMYAV